MKFLLCLLSFRLFLVSALRYDNQFVGYNLNENQTATNPLDYWGEWKDHKFHPSPSSWRFPFYTLFLDRFVNGDPANDDINGTVYEHDPQSNQLRHGGDLAGVVDSLDYIQGMGVKGLYIAGSPFINAPWKADSYSPLDLTLLDKHFGDIAAWRSAVDEIHKRGMYVMLDNTMSTMGDLIGFNGFLNATAPFRPEEHKVSWKSDRRYPDFSIGNTYKSTCDYPKFWNESGFPVLKDSNPVFSKLAGCYDSEFDQYGDTEAFGVFPDWQRQLSKFASVQDRLREWVPSVREKIQHFSCMTIAMLDIDGFRFDKATQVTVDAQAEFGAYMRQCARRYGKVNFFMPGEITGGNTLGSIYLGRGRQPDQAVDNITLAVTLTNNSNDKHFLRAPGKNALDGAAFHYSVYRSLTRFLGMSGNLAAGYDVPINFVDAWNTMLTTNDLVNADTGEFDPRHMYGVTNQDVFRWPAIRNGVDKMLLGLFITTLHIPGIPLLLWGEEQSFYVLDSTADNYIFGRQAMSSALGWQNHGCYGLNSSQYHGWPVDAALHGCHDDTVSRDHRDPSSPVHNIIKSMYYRRTQYPVLNDGYFLQSLSNQTHQVQLPGSNGTASEFGMWSVMRSQYHGVQNFTGNASQPVWLVYSNDDHDSKYLFDCKLKDALISAFDEGTTVKNLLAPYDEIELKAGPNKLGIDGSERFNGCVDELDMKAWDFRAYVPKENWLPPQPVMTRFLPGHDARIESSFLLKVGNTVDIEFQFSEKMDCDQITDNLFITSDTESRISTTLDENSVKCSDLSSNDTSPYIGGLVSKWTWKGTLNDVTHGIYTVTVRNATTDDGERFTNSNDRLIFRIGRKDNPMIFPRIANYSADVLFEDSKGLYISHKASGADRWRYSLNWESSWSDWQDYKGGNTTLAKQPWSGTKRQRWEGDHVVLQYWNKVTGSSDHIQHADADWNKHPRRFPHLFAQGSFNRFGYDGGLSNNFRQDSNGKWKLHLMTEWPSNIQINVWGVNPDGKPDSGFVMGDIDNDSVLDRLPPDSLAKNVLNISTVPPPPHLAYRIELDDANLSYRFVPTGNRFIQVLLFGLSWSLPVLTATISIWTYMGAFYGVKFNKIGVSKQSLAPLAFWRSEKFQKIPDEEIQYARKSHIQLGLSRAHDMSAPVPSIAIGVGRERKRPMILIATMEYDIEDWEIKIKIGGLGVMAQLMGKNLPHQDLIWVVPCVGGVEYPVDTPADPITVTVLGVPYDVQVQYHKLRNITYVLLDAPIFRQQSKSEPYPPRMDDLDSAVYYSAWNACIAETIKRFPVDLYHINDYHGAAAPLYLLPEGRTIPCALSLHNAEFQGLWPMRTPQEQQEVCHVYNLDQSVVEKYVQFGEVFNLLHAGASYMRVHQRGFGAVGVSNKYGKRSYARYPIFWGLKEIGKLPNPDPSDTAPWSEEEENQVVAVDPECEAQRGDLRRQAQEWAGLEVDPEAELFVFVGRWSNQKGVDLIADVFPAILEKYSNVQLICVGPVIDLYGKFAALKLGKMMEKYPKRVFSKPEFTALPPYIFSGAEFALIPSRDEPFGLVAVEFGRKGALGVGARVGGLGQMPGWWFTVESTTTKHMLHQFKSAIVEALSSKTEVRAMMRARSAKQRFPVAKWVEDLNSLQQTAIRIHNEEQEPGRHRFFGSRSRNRDPLPDASFFYPNSRAVGSDRLSAYEARSSEEESPVRSSTDIRPSGMNRTLSLGVRSGPGHSSRTAPDPLAQIYEIRPLARTPDIYDPDDEDLPGSPQASLHARDEYFISREQAEANIREMERQRTMNALERDPVELGGDSPPIEDTLLLSRGRSRTRSLHLRADDSESRSRSRHELLDPRALPLRVKSSNHHRNRSTVLDLKDIKGAKTDFSLQKVDPTFNDATGKYYQKFEDMLQNLDGKTSETDLCVEEFLVESEKIWFKRMRNERLGRGKRPSSSNSAAWLRESFQSDRSRSRTPYGSSSEDHDDTRDVLSEASDVDEFLFGKNYQRPSLVKRWMQTRIGDWPIYSLLLALGQIMAANSYQITLLTGNQGQAPEKLYILGTVFIIMSCVWWVLFRTQASKFVLSAPFLFYGTAFLFVGMAPFLNAGHSRDAIQNVATGLYVAASASGSIFFALNFGDEGGAPIKSWIFRACIIQGTQQIYITALFYWGSTMTSSSATNTLTSSPRAAAITLPIAVFLFILAIIIITSLPPYYHQTPGKIPSFYKTLIRRKIIGWFFITVTLQNYFLSTPYGRSWEYVWSSRVAPPWAVGLLALAFFIGVWAAFLFLFAKLSKNHSWFVPIFAIGLGAPRWAQMLWGTSGIGTWVPWMPGGPVAGALAGRSLWLWLGVLDALQGVGFGMILLQTLTRIHIAVSLIAAQVIGTAVTMLAKATSPDRDGPGDVFPDFSEGVKVGLSKPWFWIALACQLVIPIGFFKFFRKEQLCKP
ncbi:glycosyltransferase family 5 protein [Zopfia rhizophila CBS 207.26]|uniref:alpha-1,3-glucan synthase n=1 Tax=Zopfia rhizophila CBS 207.26 TaxID=1314779 RepID=A0A6A6DII6_9PEZI|nr:glycosyltransferase family 5 protein [Zopfia rhizophila CBS 207.26]